jgi:SAM-dependent methyltransferase
VSETQLETPAGAWKPDWARRLYRRMAPVYDPIRSVWSRWTRSVEEELDRLFSERVGPETRIVELAPGTGINIERLLRCAPRFHSYLGIDISPDMLARAREKTGGDPRFELRIGDATKLSEIEESFDFVVCTWLLSHLEDPGRAVAKAVDKLAPGGTAVFVFFTAPDRAVVRWPLRPAVRAFRARFVNPETIRRLPHLECLTRHAGGIATLAVFRRIEGATKFQEATESQ